MVKVLDRIARSRNALSPVVSSIILVSITIVIAVASSNWLGSVAGEYTASEHIDSPTTYAKWDAGLFVNGGWNVTIELKNSGSVDTSVNSVLLNGFPLKDYTNSNIVLYVDGVQQARLTSIYIPLHKGSLVRLLLQVERYKDGTGIEGCTENTRIEMKILTGGGNYPTAVRLP